MKTIKRILRALWDKFMREETDESDEDAAIQIAAW
jgi:hypothetical protein